MFSQQTSLGARHELKVLTVGSVLPNQMSVETLVYDDFSVVHPHQLNTNQEKVHSDFTSLPVRITQFITSLGINPPPPVALKCPYYILNQPFDPCEALNGLMVSVDTKKT